MKKYNTIYLIALVILYMVFTAKSCEETPAEKQERERKQFQEITNAIDESMESDYLSKESFLAFEEKAKQKIIDFGEFFSLYSRKDLDPELKKSVATQLNELFQAESIIEIKWAIDMPQEKYRLDDLLMKISASKYDLLQVINDSIHVLESMEKINRETYKGSLIFKQDIYGISSFDTISMQHNHVQTDYYVKKVEKNFGIDTRSTWQVFIGTMKLQSSH